MTSDEALQKYGLPASPSYRDEIRRLLAEETERARESEEGDEMLRTLCVQLCSIGNLEDVLLIWEAKRSNFDAWCGLDIQFLCGAGLAATKELLAASSAPSASEALEYLCECERAGDFANWTPQTSVEMHRGYYGL